MMPYITAFFMPRAKGDRPNVVPDGCVNFAFIGQFAEPSVTPSSPPNTRSATGMEAAYTLLNIDRGVPEVWGSCYDIRALLDATSKMMDGKKLTEIKLPFGYRMIEKKHWKRWKEPSSKRC